MADYWKSNNRKYCDFCKCWIGDNKASISFHENGKRHKMNVTKRISLISRNSEKAEKEQQQMEAEIRKMEKAALSAYARDIHAGRDLTAIFNASNSNGTKNLVKETSTSGVHSEDVPRQIDPLRLSVNIPSKIDSTSEYTQRKYTSNIQSGTLWVEGKSDEGHTYYWNVKTKESVWKTPAEGYLSWKEFQSINELAVKQEKMRQLEEAKKFRENVNENVARYNRERLKLYRVPEMISQKDDASVDKASIRNFKTEDEIVTPKIGSWLTIEKRPATPSIDLQLPQLNKPIIMPAVLDLPPEPPVKRFKEKTIQSLDLDEPDQKPTTFFKKRKLPATLNMRKPLQEDTT